MNDNFHFLGQTRTPMPFGAWLVSHGFDDDAPMRIPRRAGLAQMRTFTTVYGEYFDFTDAELEALYALYCHETGMPRVETLRADEMGSDELDAVEAIIFGGGRR